MDGRGVISIAKVAVTISPIRVTDPDTQDLDVRGVVAEVSYDRFNLMPLAYLAQPVACRRAEVETTLDAEVEIMRPVTFRPYIRPQRIEFKLHKEAPEAPGRRAWPAVRMFVNDPFSCGVRFDEHFLVGIV